MALMNLSLYVRGMTAPEIQARRAELYGAEVSPDLISRVTDAVLEEVREWQSPPLDALHPIRPFRHAVVHSRQGPPMHYRCCGGIGQAGWPGSPRPEGAGQNLCWRVRVTRKTRIASKRL